MFPATNDFRKQNKQTVKATLFDQEIEQFPTSLPEIHQRVRQIDPVKYGKTRNFKKVTVPQPGQVGYHQRTEHNKRVIKIGDKGEEITPSGGFLHYGVIRNPYILLHGTVPGPTKRLVKLRDAVRFRRTEVDSVDVAYISTQSKQGA